MIEGEIKEIYLVVGYFKSDFVDFIVGDFLDKDFSNVKFSNQINFSIFSIFIDFYFWLFIEEDFVFLRERGDCVILFVMLKCGKKYYIEIWVEEDGVMVIDFVFLGGWEKFFFN